MSTRNTCSYEVGTSPGFYYSTGSGAGNFQQGQVAAGDVFSIMGQGGSCALGVTTPGTQQFTSKLIIIYCISLP